MRELYQITCKECDLKIKEGREKGGGMELNSVKPSTEKTKEISSQDKFVFSNKQPIGITSNSPVREIVQVEKQDGKSNVNCPRCHSNQTLILRLDDWIIDYHIW